MVRANRRTLDEAMEQPSRLFDAAKTQSPQVVMTADGIFTVLYEERGSKASAAAFLVAGGPEDTDLEGLVEAVHSPNGPSQLYGVDAGLGLNQADADSYLSQATADKYLADTSLTFSARAILSNQYQILEKIDPSRASDYAQSREIVESGYESLYETINPAIRTTVEPAKASREVPAILDMFLAVEKSAGILGRNADEFSIAFEGFDSEHDEHHFGFAYFLRRKQGKWQELSHYPDKANGPMLTRYRKLLAAWHALGRPYEMTEAQMRELAAGN